MSRWNLFRRRVIGPVMFLGGIALLARETCVKQQRTHATIVLELGDAEPNVRAIDAELVIGGETISTFHRAALTGLRIGPCQFATAMPDPEGELRIDIELESGHKHLVRHVHADENATVSVKLASDLR